MKQHKRKKNIIGKKGKLFWDEGANKKSQVRPSIQQKPVISMPKQTSKNMNKAIEEELSDLFCYDTILNIENIN